MELSEFRTNPTGIRHNVQITGPGGSKTVSRILSVDSRVVSPGSDVVHTETIKMIDNAVVPGKADVSDATNDIKRVTVTAGDDNNCYWLPWGEGYLYWGQLGDAYNYFFTYTINGCGVVIGGERDAPVVFHANLDCDRLNQVAIAASKLPPSESGKFAAKEQSIIYDQFYGNLAAKLIDRDDVAAGHVEVITPNRYLILAGAGYGAVFGIRKEAGWEFYGNWAKSTARVWP